MSPSSVTSRGVACTLMPTVRNVYDDSGFTFAPPPAIGENDVVRYGSSAPTFSVELRALGAAQLRLGEKARVHVGLRGT